MEQNYIPVLTRSGRPLAPCHPNRAKSLAKAGKGKLQHRRGIRCLILNKTNIPKVKNSSILELRIDPGSRTTGIAITRDNPNGSRSSLTGIEIQHQGKTITRRLIKRRQLRRNRRYRKTRYRKPRFQNRTRPDGWLPPSIKSRLQNTLTWANRLSQILPIREVHVEATTFDPQILRDPEIQGTAYQQGPLYKLNLRTAVLQRDSQRCVYCGQTGKNRPLELDHAIPKSLGGPDRYDNLLASCRTCNQRRGNQSLEAFLKRRPAKLRAVQAKLGIDLADPTHMNIIIPELCRNLQDEGWTVIRHAAATTAAGRRVCNIDKSHHGDAAVTGCPTGITRIPSEPITIRAVGRGTRQRLVPDKYGTPRGKGYRDYCRLPKEVQRVTPTPSHKKREKRVGNITTGDYVTFMHKGRGSSLCLEGGVQTCTPNRKGMTAHGYGSISHNQVALTRPKWRSIRADRATVLERNHGYQVSYPGPQMGNPE